MYLQHSRAYLIIVIVAFSLCLMPLTGWAQDDTVKDELFKTLQEKFEQAESQNVELFSPKNYKLSQDYYSKAIKAYDKEKSLKTIRGYVEKSQEYLDAALENTEISIITFGDLIQLRETAISYEIDKSAPKSFASAESKFKQASGKIESGSTRSAKSAAKTAEKSYRAAVIKVLQKDYLADARVMLKDVKKDIFKDTYKSALHGLKETEEYLKYQSKSEFSIEEIFPEVHRQISQALAIAEIKYPDLIIGGVVINTSESRIVSAKSEIAQEKKAKTKTESKKTDVKIEKVYESLPPISQDLMNQEEQIKRLMSPSSQKNLAQSVSDFEVLAYGIENEQGLTDAASETVQNLYEDGKLGAINIDKASFLVILNAVDEMDEDIKVILDEIEEMQLTQQEIADFKSKLAEYSDGSADPVLAGDLEEFRYKYNTEWDKTPNLSLEYIRTPQIKLRSLNKIEKENLAAEIQALNALSDGLNDISEIVQLKLQMAMDRRAKYISTLSAIMTKISQTQDAVIDNIK